VGLEVDAAIALTASRARNAGASGALAGQHSTAERYRFLARVTKGVTGAGEDGLGRFVRRSSQIDNFADNFFAQALFPDGLGVGNFNLYRRMCLAGVRTPFFPA